MKDTGIPDVDLLGIGERMALNLNNFYNIGDGDGAIDEFEVEVAGAGATVTGLKDRGLVGEGMGVSYDETQITKDGLIAIVGLSEGITVITVSAIESEFDDLMVATFTVTTGTEVEVGEAAGDKALDGYGAHLCSQQQEAWRRRQVRPEVHGRQ